MTARLERDATGAEPDAPLDDAEVARLVRRMAGRWAGRYLAVVAGAIVFVVVVSVAPSRSPGSPTGDLGANPTSASGTYRNVGNAAPAVSSPASSPPAAAPSGSGALALATGSDNGAAGLGATGQAGADNGSTALSPTDTGGLLAVLLAVDVTGPALPAGPTRPRPACARAAPAGAARPTARPARRAVVGDPPDPAQCATTHAPAGHRARRRLPGGAGRSPPR